MNRFVLSAGDRVARLRDRLAAAVSDERGDVPGWVLITLMTAGLLVLTIMGE